MKTVPDLQTPVAFFIFNRPDTTRRVFEEIRRAKPPKLLVVADGPRISRSDDVERCAATRAIVDQVDWECDVLTNYSEGNLGCRRRVSSGLDWVFERVEEAIILEDDCLPHPSFFQFCDEQLKHYRCDKRVMAISGDNFQFGHKQVDHSYYFSRYYYVWGWATWRRAWQYYDVGMTLWPSVKSGNWLKGTLIDDRALTFWRHSFQTAYDGTVDTWDFQWVFACWTQSGFCVVPNTNLVSNIGFNKGSTHTTRPSMLANLPMGPMSFPLRHPSIVAWDIRADSYVRKNVFRINSFQRVKGAIRRILNLG